MSNMEAPFSFTTKVNGDLLTVRGSSFEEFVGNLGHLLQVQQIAGLVNVLQGVSAQQEQVVVAEVQNVLGGTVVSAPAQMAPAPAVAPVAPQVFQPVAPQPIAPVAPVVPVAQQAPTQAPTCQHGAMKLIPGGISKKNGKPYNPFWACQWPNRDEQCPAVFS